MQDVPEIQSNFDNGEEDISKDYALLRQKIQHILIRSEEILDEATKTTKVMPNAMNITAFSSLVNSLSESSKMLLDVHKEILNIKEKQAKIEQIKKEIQTQTQNDKTSFNTSLKEILKIIKTEKEA